MSELSGVIPAIPTPLLENEDVDIPALRKIIDYVIAEGASGVFVLGNMGEGPALVDSQRSLVIKESIACTAARVPLLVGISDVSTRRMIERGQQATAWKPDYVVITTPYFYRFPHPESLYESARRITTELDYPSVFYHCPGATGNKVPLDAMLKIMNLPNIKALKDSSGDFTFFGEILRRYPDKNDRPCSILQGSESIYDMSLLLGADGIITGGGTAFIDILVKLCTAARKMDRLVAFDLQQQFRRQMDHMLGSELSIDWMYAIKKELSKKGLCHPFVTSPFLKRDRSC